MIELKIKTHKEMDAAASSLVAYSPELLASLVSDSSLDLVK